MSLASGDLTTLANAKSYINTQPTDAILSRLITSVSRMVLGELNRPLIVPKTYTERYSVNRNVDGIVLWNWPVLSVSSVSFVDFSPSTLYQGRLVFESWDGLPPGQQIRLDLLDGFGWGFGTSEVVYRAGYQVTSETRTIPVTPFQVTPNTPYGIWATDEGVTFLNGSILTPITSGTPIHGQYLAPDPSATPTPRLTYLFAAADVGLGVKLNYGFIPFELEQLVIELIAERSSYRARVGLRSQVLAGQETISYDLSGIPSYAARMLQPYKNVLPPPIGVF